MKIINISHIIYSIIGKKESLSIVFEKLESLWVTTDICSGWVDPNIPPKLCLWGRRLELKKSLLVQVTQKGDLINSQLPGNFYTNTFVRYFWLDLVHWFVTWVNANEYKANNSSFVKVHVLRKQQTIKVPSKLAF